MENIKYKATSKFNDRVWIPTKYLDLASRAGVGITITYRKKKMVIPPERVKPEFFEKGDRKYQDLFTGEPYRLWGVHFIENNKQTNE